MSWRDHLVWLDLGGALLVVALSLVVWRVRPRAPLNRRFALLVSSWGAGLVAANAWEIGWLRLDHVTWINLATMAGVIAATLAFALVFPTRLAREDWRGLGPLRHAVWAAPAGVLLLSLALQPTFYEVWRTQDPAPGPALLVLFYLEDILFVTWVGLGSLLALRFAAAAPEERAFRSQAALVAVAVLLYPLFYEGAGILNWARLAPTELSMYAGVLWVALELAPAALWLRAAARAQDAAAARLARRVALALLATFLAGMVYLAWDPVGPPDSLNGTGGAIRLVATALVGYAILKHQLFDIDLKVKWTLRQGTLAATFVGVFFFVSEAAAVFLGETTGSTYWGIAATALLVFALAPLQRVAERLADTAMPRVRETPDYISARKRDIYRSALASAISDGVITEKERDVLATLADELGLGAGEARAMERELLAGRA